MFCRVLGSSHILSAASLYQGLRVHWARHQACPPYFLIRKGCTFQISRTWPLSSRHTIVAHLSWLGGNAVCPKTSCWLTSLFLLVQCFPQLINQKLRAYWLFPLLLLWAHSLVDSRYPCPRHWLKKTRARLQILKTYQGRKHESCSRASASTFPLEMTSV